MSLLATVFADPGGMAPVTSDGVDGPVNAVGQVVATVATFALAVVAVVVIGRMCVRERIAWPFAVLAGGTVTCLLEPLFDHLYGLWFPTIGQWTLFVTYGLHEPVWLPAAYLVVYGALAIWCARTLDRAPTMRTVWRLYGALVVVAIVAEIAYISALGVYNYQDQQPFVVLGYPLFLGFVNSMSALIGGIAIHALVPHLHGRARLALATIPPLAFGVDAIGSGVLYLALRHSENPPMWLLYIGALTVVGGGALTVRLMAMLLPAGRGEALPAPDDSVVPAAQRTTADA
ncbi:hypothetical protein LQ327_14500 [Actinomycetospora endophytica]|uniref:Uncharacterized protein n=1 Tax=Actinomycetospora endophytica TaxID=2291215 RepID=A0ABS8P8I0_9PSEU|nr:hypothetical protein [Actinomycetospora endophytica]MCD2194580.1 hypothetical protein [Actinomycetospora endophytica]